MCFCVLLSQLFLTRTFQCSSFEANEWITNENSNRIVCEWMKAYRCLLIGRIVHKRDNSDFEFAVRQKATRIYAVLEFGFTVAMANITTYTCILHERPIIFLSWLAFSFCKHVASDCSNCLLFFCFLQRTFITGLAPCRSMPCCQPYICISLVYNKIWSNLQIIFFFVFISLVEINAALKELFCFFHDPVYLLWGNIYADIFHVLVCKFHRM